MIIYRKELLNLIYISFIIHSCNGQSRNNDNCEINFKKARELAYVDSVRQSALDSALYLANKCMQCSSIKKSVVDFKISLLVSMKKYEEGIDFIDSLKESDFTYGYKQNLLSKGLKALEYSDKKDTINRNKMYREISGDLEQYIRNKSIGENEFKEIYTDLFSIKENYLDSNQINSEVEALKNKYPDKKSFFDFFKK